MTGQIAIEPANPDVVYVPSYRPETVYVSRPTAQPYIAPPRRTAGFRPNPVLTGALTFGAALLVQELFGSSDDDHNDDGWDDYWHHDRPIDWRDRQFFPRPRWEALHGRERPWSWERDRY